MIDECIVNLFCTVPTYYTLSSYLRALIKKHLWRLPFQIQLHQIQEHLWRRPPQLQIKQFSKVSITTNSTRICEHQSIDSSTLRVNYHSNDVFSGLRVYDRKIGFFLSLTVIIIPVYSYNSLYYIEDVK